MRNVGNTCILDHACDNSESQENIYLNGVDMAHAKGVLIVSALYKGTCFKTMNPGFEPNWAYS